MVKNALITSVLAATAALSAPVFAADATPTTLPTALTLEPSSPTPASPTPTTAPETPVDKSAYNLFNPVPQDQLRDFNSDRPDVTESPFTIDPGHFQVELSFVEYTHDESGQSRTDGFSVLPFNLRIGVTSNIEVDIIGNPYLNILERGKNFSQRTSGFGDLTLRSKINLWGNDGGDTAAGIIPFVTLPTGTGGASDHHVEGGIILPFAVNLPWGFDLGTMAEFDFNRNTDDNGYGTDFVHSVTLGHDLVEHLAAYIEYAGISPINTGETYLGYFDTGLTWAVTKNIQLDTGINIGLSKHADDFTVFTGLSFRI